MNTYLPPNTVSVFQSEVAEYPVEAPFHPSIPYPEYPFRDLRQFAGQPVAFNRAYDAVRESLRLLGLDAQHYGTPEWNPFSAFIKIGSSVVIKPNAVWSVNLKVGETVFASITHGSVLRAVIDYVYIALKGKGKIIVADSPLSPSSFPDWLSITGLGDVVEFYRSCAGFEIGVYDLRRLIAPWDFQYHYTPAHLRRYNDGDPLGHLLVDLAGNSLFADVSEDLCRRIYGSDYNHKITVQHHTNGHHEYLVARTFLDADAIISVPKLKVHSKVGVTINLKGMVGTQGDKNFIPHHRIGIPARGGDESPDQGWLQNTVNRYRMWLLTEILARQTPRADKLYRVLAPLHGLAQRLVDDIGRLRFGAEYSGNIVGGSWYGNDTAWRMALDLTRIILFVDRKGQLCNSQQRHFFSVIDGIIGGENAGPLAPSAKSCGVILSGANPLAVDLVASRLMGFDPSKIKMLEQGLGQTWLNSWGQAQQIEVVSNNTEYTRLWNTSERYLNFVAANGWRGHIET